MGLTPSNVEALNDRLAREHPIDAYYESSPLPIRWIERHRLRIIRDMAGPTSGRRVCEVGAGGGHVLAMFRDSKLTAIDVSDVFLDQAKKRLAGYNVEFIKGEIDKMNLSGQTFDVIICTEVLEHTEDPDGILRAIATLLHNRGRAIITIPNDPLINRLKRAVRRTPVGWALGDRIEWGGDEFHLHQWTPTSFRTALSAHFEVRSFRAAPHRHLPIRLCYECHPKQRAP